MTDVIRERILTILAMLAKAARYESFRPSDRRVLNENVKALLILEYDCKDPEDRQWAEQVLTSLNGARGPDTKLWKQVRKRHVQRPAPELGFSEDRNEEVNLLHRNNSPGSLMTKEIRWI
jgi:hypothetical protein